MRPNVKKGNLEYDDLLADFSGHLLKYITLDDSEAAPIARGTVLGRITASKKFKVCKDANGDGSEVPVAILADDFKVGNDKSVPAYLAGSFNSDALVVDEGVADKEKLEIELHKNSIFLI